MSNNHLKNKTFDVLIVEDELILAMNLEIKLKKLGLNVAGIAVTADRATILSENKNFDLAIVDINLNSKKTGIDVANHIWKNHNIPIIFLTSYYNDKILNEALEAEPYAYLIKPCRDSELKVAINTTLHKHHYFFKNKNSFNSKTPKMIQILENLKFDKSESNLYLNDEIFKLTKNEKKLFEILSDTPGEIISFSSIFNYIWREDVYDLSRLRSLIYRLKNKIGENPFENLYEEGYRIKTFENN